MVKKEKLHAKIRDYYSETVLKEWKRLIKSPKQKYLEFYTTMFFLNKYLPKKGLVLDGGSGPGRYTVELTKRGNDIIALDPVENSLVFLRKAVKNYGDASHLKKVINGRLEDLSMLKSNSFDAVISLGGPLSHIMSTTARRKAAHEILRVAKPGAKIFVSVMTRTSLILGLLTEFPNELGNNYTKTWIKTGDYFGEKGFTAFHGFFPSELVELFYLKDFRKITLVGLEGFGSYAGSHITKLYKNKRRLKQWLKMHMETVEEPSILGVSEHILLIGEKKH